jgi:hypothetical protein
LKKSGSLPIIPSDPSSEDFKHDLEEIQTFAEMPYDLL